MDSVLALLGDIGSRMLENLVGRLGGPMKFRLVLQPVMAILFAIRAGAGDAASGKPPYVWTLLASRGDRRALLRDGWKDVGKVFLLAVLLDVAYQLVVLRAV